MPTHQHAVSTFPRSGRSLTAPAEKRNANRPKRAAFLRNLSLLLIALFLTSPVCLVGCALSPKPKLPEVVGETPTFEELQTAVNANSEKIETIFSSDASIGVATTPGWAKCQIAFERPGNLRVVGSAPAMGRVVDVGCNEERFWFWSDFQNSNELYFCRLDQYQNSAAARVLPLDPTWFPEAFGVVELKDEELVDGPVPQDDGSLLVTLKKTRQDGTYLKRVYFEPKTAALLRQDVQGPNGETVVSIRCKRSVYVESPGVVLPQKIEIKCPQMDDALIVDVGTPVLNDSSKIAEKAFQQPTDLKAKAIDLGAVAAPSSAPVSQTVPDASNATAASAATVGTPAPATFETPQTQIQMIARARVEAIPNNAFADSQTLAAAPTVATAQTFQPAPSEISVAPTTASVYQAPQVAQNAPTLQAPQVAQNAPTFQTPQIAQNAPTLQAPQVAQNAPTLQAPQIAQNAPTLQAPQVAQNAPTFQTPQVAQNAPTLQAPQVAQNAPTFQAPQVAQNAPTFQTPQNDLLEAPPFEQLDAPFPDQSAPSPRPAATLEDFDALLPPEEAASPFPADFPNVDVPAPIGPVSEVVGAPRAAL